MLQTFQVAMQKQFSTLGGQLDSISSRIETIESKQKSLEERQTNFENVRSNTISSSLLLKLNMLRETVSLPHPYRYYLINSTTYNYYYIHSSKIRRVHDSFDEDKRLRVDEP